MEHAELMAWRKSMRLELLDRRQALPEERLHAFRLAIDQHLERGFPSLCRGVVAFCWPIRKEYDARFLIHRLRERGAVAALPVVVAPKTALIFREWHPGVEMAVGGLDIPYPKCSSEAVPNTVLLPMNGFDRQGFRLGYGAGFFDRTLAVFGASKPLVIGVTFELAAMETIDPQAWDIPADFVVTERGIYRRDGTRKDSALTFIGAPANGIKAG